MGPYCRYCQHRCFVPRIIPDRPGETILLATCSAGMKHDLNVTGHTYLTTVSPYQERNEN